MDVPSAEAPDFRRNDVESGDHSHHFNIMAIMVHKGREGIIVHHSNHYHHSSKPPLQSSPCTPKPSLTASTNIPRIQLAHKNTPFEEMPRLRAAIAESMGADLDAVPLLFIKRDDATGFAFGGNKARHMEFLFADLIERGIDTIVNVNHYDSNNARLAAAASAKTGIKYHWVAYDLVDEPMQGNMLIAHLTGAIIHRVTTHQDANHLAEKS